LVPFLKLVPSWGRLNKDDLITTKGVDELVQFSSLVCKAIVQCFCRALILIGARFGADRQMEVAQGLVDVDGHDAPEVKANENMPDSGMKGFASRIN
jgi:hypothetical protein